MHTATVETRHRTDAVRHTAHVELRTAHVEVAHSIARMDLGDDLLWARMDPVVARVVSEAYDVTAALTGHAAATPATSVPPVVRVRELASAQERLFTALDRRQPPEAVAHRSVHLLRALHGRLYGDVPRR